MSNLLYSTRSVLAGICLCLLFGGFSSLEGDWKDDMYAQYNFNTFAKLDMANRPLDLSAKNVDYALLNAAIFFETNRQRDLNKLPQFTRSKALENAAFSHARDMVVKNFFSHTSPIAGKEDMSNRLDAVGIPGWAVAENIAMNFVIDLEAGKSYYSPSQNGGYFSYEYKGAPIKPHTYVGMGAAFLDQWMNSPGHKRNILNTAYTHLGCGGYMENPSDPDEVHYVKATQNFSAGDADYTKFPNIIDYH